MAILKTAQCGACDFETKNPEVISASTKAIKITVPFDDALKLKAAVDECVLRLNRYNRSTVEGRRARMGLVIHLDKKRFRVLETKA